MYFECVYDARCEYHDCSDCFMCCCDYCNYYQSDACDNSDFLCSAFSFSPEAPELEQENQNYHKHQTDNNYSNNSST